MIPIHVEQLDFEQLVDTYYEALYRFAVSLTGREAEASDITQETFYRWATKGRTLRDKSKVKSWLFTTLYREFLGSRRRESRHPHFEVDSVAHELPVVAPSIVNEIDGSTALQALMEIDPLYRAPLMLFYQEEHSYREIAEILDIPTGTVMSRLSRGKVLLRQVLAVKATGKARKIVPLTSSENQA